MKSDIRSDRKLFKINSIQHEKFQILQIREKIGYDSDWNFKNPEPILFKLQNFQNPKADPIRYFKKYLIPTTDLIRKICIRVRISDGSEIRRNAASYLIIDNNSLLAFSRTSTGIVWCFLGALLNSRRSFSVCIHLIMSFVPDELAKFIVFLLPLENEIYTLLEKSELVKHI